MVDGAALMLTPFYGARASGAWGARGTNLLDTGAPFYEVYETSDGKWFCIGAIERQFYAELLRVLGLDATELPDQMDRTQWPAMKERFAAIFRTRSRDQWTEAFDGTDACGAPVLSPWEAHEHPHNQFRGTFVEIDGVLQPGPAPRFSRTPSAVQSPPAVAGRDTDEALASWGVDEARVTALRQQHAIG
jgi:alpha-methylacyl-CoA racemase